MISYFDIKIVSVQDGKEKVQHDILVSESWRTVFGQAAVPFILTCCS